MVTSREGTLERSVRAWFVVTPPGVVYLFTEAFSVKARRWRTDPWIRLTIPSSRESVEGVVHFVGAAEVDPALADRVIRRWADWGVTHLEGLRRMIAANTHALVRVDPISAGAAAGTA